ncbi:putative anoctamin-2-like protein [Labeo rohita]|uniref:Putative anoctamin-2-like protein n=1 Tax=Labeo rohita TaxID=84645 RepID=A0A498MH44_LABRO|nr:putative anoctamin-2-like protein [Labeo rohita]
MSRRRNNMFCTWITWQNAQHTHTHTHTCTFADSAEEPFEDTCISSPQSTRETYKGYYGEKSRQYNTFQSSGS